MSEDEHKFKKANILDAYQIGLLTYKEARDSLVVLDAGMIKQRLREVKENEDRG